MILWLSQFLYGLEISLRNFRLRVTGAKLLIDKAEDAIENDDFDTAEELVSQLTRRCGATEESVTLQSHIFMGRFLEECPVD